MSTPTDTIDPQQGLRAAALLQGIRPAVRRERSITVETEGLGVVRVRRVSLGGIARVADRLRAERNVDDDALVDALIGEVASVGTGGGPGRRPDATQIGRLTEEDRRSIAAAVLTLEGVKAAGEGVVEHPLDSLVQRYGPVVGLRERRRAPTSLMFADPGPVAPRDAAVDHRLPDDLPDDAAAAPEPQIPLFDGAQLPPAEPYRLPDAEPSPPPPGSRAARVAADRSRAQVQALLDAQQQALLEVADDHRALADEVAALSARAAGDDAWTMRTRWAAAGALVVALAAPVVAGVVDARRDRRVEAELQQLRAQVREQDETIRELRAALRDRGAVVRRGTATAPARATAPVTRERARGR